MNCEQSIVISRHTKNMNKKSKTETYINIMHEYREKPSRMRAKIPDFVIVERKKKTLQNK